MAMGPRDTTKWAQEMILSEIDVAIRNSFGMLPSEMDFDDIEAVRKQRNRVAKMFGLPVKTTWND